MYDYIIVTHIPAFYKANLYNKLVEKLNILVIFIASNTDEKRADDFIALENADFNYEVLYDGNFQDRDVLHNIKKLKSILKNLEYKKIIVSGWDLKEFWYLIFTNTKQQNCLALESTILESNAKGIKGFIKRLFLSRISTVFASGQLHIELLKELNYKDSIKTTKGVGIINKPTFKTIKKDYQKRFLFIGRLSKVKNIEILIGIFNELDDYTLTIIGTGEDEEYLKSISKSNSIFLGAIENKDIKDKFQENDIFILPSMSEPWGLVVEEALYFGLPVIVSKNCGSVELVENDVNGYVVNPTDKNDIKKSILSIDNDKYERLLKGVEKFSIDEKDKWQVEVYDI